ncbi:MAG: hypothetical protein ACRDL7_16425, partial [Gaiellaceae bacterium]
MRSETYVQIGAPKSAMGLGMRVPPFGINGTPYLSFLSKRVTLCKVKLSVYSGTIRDYSGKPW